MNHVAYTPPPTCARFMRSNAFVRAIVGPLGSGKSSTCLNELLKRSVEQRPWQGVRRTRFAVVRNTYRELEDTTRKSFEQWPMSKLGRWYESDFMFSAAFRLTDGTRVESEVLFRALDKPEHVKKLLSLELTGAYLNEAKELPKGILDMLTGRVGRYPSMAQGGPSWSGIWMDTNPWHTGHWGYRLFTKEAGRHEGYELYEQPSAIDGHGENLANLVPGYYERQLAGKSQAWVDEYLRAMYPSNDKGSVYGGLIAAVEARGGVHAFDFSPDNLFTVWDLGRADSTAIWLLRVRSIQDKQTVALDFVDHYENRGQGIRHYLGLLDAWAKDKGYRYLKHWLPHDARAKTLATSLSTVEQVAAHFGHAAVAIAPNLSLEDGIEAGRWLLEQEVRMHTNCTVAKVMGMEPGLEALRAYHYGWDEQKQTYTKEPVHDWSSHTADAFRYSALVGKALAGLLPAAELPPEEWRSPRTLLEWGAPKSHSSGRVG